jgi:hypothetical protein
MHEFSGDGGNVEESEESPMGLLIASLAAMVVLAYVFSCLMYREGEHRADKRAKAQRKSTEQKT